MFEYFVPELYQFKKAVNARNVGTMGVIPNLSQANKLIGRKNKVVTCLLFSNSDLVASLKSFKDIRYF